MNREAWLESAVDEFRPLFQGINKPLDKVRVSVGWPSRGGLGKAKKTIGQCWFGTMSKDGIPQIYISPLLADPIDRMGVLPTLLHELVHVVAGFDAAHGPKFGKICKQLGLEGKPTSTHAGEATLDRMKQIVEKLGAFPHSEIVPLEKLKKQTTRMKKIECGDCKYLVRTAQKWLDAYGAPICPCNKKVMLVGLPEGGEEEGDE